MNSDGSVNDGSGDGRGLLFREYKRKLEKLWLIVFYRAGNKAGGKEAGCGGSFYGSFTGWRLRGLHRMGKERLRR